jgi:dTDP-4-amino-4,6-dideoxygalactose transaminase
VTDRLVSDHSRPTWDQTRLATSRIRITTPSAGQAHRLLLRWVDDTGTAVSRIYLSPPDVGPVDRQYLLDAFDSNWVAPTGPNLDAFEAEVAQVAHRKHAVALASGTAALHLALIAVGVQPGSDVLVPTLTFVATANVVRYLGARPVFLDSELQSWNIDPDLLDDELARRQRRGNLPAAVIAVDLYGQCADYTRILAACARYDIPLIEDAAEALGATHSLGPAGSFGCIATFSFNGNKIITTSAGGMLATDDNVIAAHVRRLANQGRAPAIHYEHTELGFNYRMSNLLAALGRAQLRSLDDRVHRRTEIERRYRAALAGLPGVEFSPRAPWGAPNHWLTCLTLDPRAAAVDRNGLIAALGAADIEARPTWKPMHQQPVHRSAPSLLRGVADQIFGRGLCLPSGSSLTEADQRRVIEVARSVLEHC